MARPPAKDLTERELEVMHVFWSQGEATAAQARDRLDANGLDRTYTTIANLVRGLHDKGFLSQVNAERPFLYRAARSYQDASSATWSIESSGDRDRCCWSGSSIRRD
jgi:BlaI family penicillinase repressor